MNTRITNSITLLLLICTINSISDNIRINNIVEFTKFSDKRDLLDILTKLQNEKLLLQSTISQHSLKCKSILDTCKTKFDDRNCEMTHKIKKNEIIQNINVTETSLYDNTVILKDVNRLYSSSKKDCSEIENFFHTSNKKLQKDVKIINNIKKKLKIKLKKLNAKEKKRKSMESPITNITGNQSASKKISKPKPLNKMKIISTQNQSTPLNKSETLIPKSAIKNQTLLNDQFVSNLTATKSNISTTKNISNTKDKEPGIMTGPSNTSITKSNKTSNMTINESKLGLNNTKFIEVDIDEEEHKGLFSNLFEKITGVFSLIQLKSNGKDNLNKFSFTQIETKLEKILSPTEKINFLITSLHEFNVVINSIKESKEHSLKKSFTESQRSCRRRISDYQSKIKQTETMYIESKVTLEMYKKSLEIQESKLRLCDIRKNDILLCNDMNSYCEKYEVEYNAELRELDDLIMFFKTYIEKYY